MEVGTVQRVDIEQKMRSAYLSYAMSVITARALPDVRDGLKPVQRRILYAMHDMGLRPDRPTRKSARIVGEVLGKYHPHGDTAVYDAMVRMAQDFSMRYPLVDGQGNFGSIDGDGAAAMRYTEARLTAIGEELLIDIDKDTVDFVDNFDASLQEPSVLPGKLPNLLLNGVGGIAVGMATNIPPHNLGEISDAIAYLVDNYDRAEDVSLDDLMRFVQGPDFPTGGMILGSEGIRQAYATGKGRIIVRALAHVEEMRGSHQAVVVTELPYQVNKSNLVERIAKLVRDERIEGIGDLRDESDRTGMRIVIELKRGTEVDPVMEQLLKYTQLQTTFGANMLALVDGEPRLLPLKRALLHYIDHRYDVLVRRTRFELERALARAHILEGLLIALDNLDEVIATIRRSRTVDTARTNLMRRFKLSEEQAQAILDMQLRRLAALEQRRIQEEYEQILVRIEYLRELLASKEKMLGLVKQDVVDLKKAYGDPRRTRICESDDKGEFKAEDLVPDEDVCVLLTAEGLVRRLPASAYTSRRTNVPGMYARERDALAEIFVAHSQESIVFFTDKGNAYALPAHQVPDVSQQESGLPLADLVRLGNDERVIAMLHLPDEGDDLFVSMATRGGQIKRLALEELASLGRAGTTVIGLGDYDSLGCALLTKGEDELVMVTEQGNAIRFASDTVRPQGRSASGMRGISLKEDDRVAGMDVVREDGELLIVTDLGFAKRTPLAEYNTQGRGGQGALTVDASKTRISGPVVDARVVLADDEIILTTTGRDMQRMPISDIPRLGRATWGRLVTRTRRNAAIQVENDRVVAAVRLTSSLGGEDASSDEPEEQGAGSGDDGASAAVSRPRTRRRRASASASDRQAAADASPEPQTPTATRGSRGRSRSQSAAQETSAPASAG
ncbi:MAG: DNA gyrase subunit A, partial [Anaerolineae bacterium]|nr:DNA gyrase subunit A [Anaerolineae bacterium]